MSPKIKFADSAKFNTYALVFLVLGVSLLVAALSYFNVPKLSLNTSAAALQGDLNNDGIVNSIDWSLMNSKWLTNDTAADLNSDGIVNTVDWSIMNSNWLKSTPPPVVPPPQPPPPPSGGSTHSYFNSLVARADHLVSWSLRSQALLDGLTAAKSSTFFTYAPAQDSYSEKQDAAKFYVPAGRASANTPINQQLKMPIPNTTGTLLITWDWYWGPEFLTQRGGMNHYKVFKFYLGGHAWWTLMHSPAWVQQSGEVAKVWDSIATPSGLPEGMVVREPTEPTGSGTPNQGSKTNMLGWYPGKWYRYWVEIKLLQPHTAFTDWNSTYGVTLRPNSADPQGRWHMVSYWVADENNNAKRLMYRIPMGFASNWNPTRLDFHFLMNTSQSSGFIGPWIGYGRNVVVLRNYNIQTSNPESDPIFQRPVK